MMMIYALYFHRVSPMCTPMYEFTCYQHCYMYAITPLIPLLSSSPSAAHVRQGNGIRAPLAATAAPASTAG